MSEGIDEVPDRLQEETGVFEGLMKHNPCTDVINISTFNTGSSNALREPH